MQREVNEETGIQISGVTFPLHVGYFNEGLYRFKNVIRIIYLAKVKTSKVWLSTEHTDYKWVTLHELKKLRPTAFIDPRVLKNLIKRIEYAMNCNSKMFQERVGGMVTEV